MSTELTPKEAMLSALYFVIAVVLLVLLDFGLDWLLDNVVFNILNWFNRLTLFFKIFVFLIGGFTLFISLLQITGRMTTLLGGLIFNKLPQNLFTVIAPFVLAIANAVYCIIILWKVPAHYNFWIVVELIIISVFIWQLCAIVMPAKEQMKSRLDY